MKQPKIVILTGAGISAESGLATFRDNNGLWEDHQIEDVATPQAFLRDPELVYRFYNARRAQLQRADVQPNAAHKSIAELQQRLGDNVTIITQNVDNLHERGGSYNVLHMHGTLLSYRCLSSHQPIYYTAPYDSNTRCHCCDPGSKVRPDIVWFGETPKYMQTIMTALSQADMFIAIGTSGQVYPAAGFVEIARDSNVHSVEINLQSAANKDLFDETWQGPASETVPAFFNTFLKTLS